MLKDLVVQAEAFHHAGDKVLDEDVEVVEQFQKCLLVAFVLEVQDDALLAPVDAHEIGALAVYERPRAPGHVSSLGALHFNNLSPEVGKDHRCIGTGEHPGKVENFHTI